MLAIDLRGKRALVAGVADDGGFGFAIAKSLAEAGATIVVGTWPPAYGIFTTMLERGKLDASRVLADGRKLDFERIYPLDADYDTLADATAELKESKRFLAYEAGRKWGHRVNVLSAGPYASRAASAIGFIDTMIAYCKANSPLPEALTAREVGDTAAFVCSPLGSGITGTTIYVDKGYH